MEKLEKDIAKINSDIEAVTTQIENVESTLEKDLVDWTQQEKNKYGNHEKLRDEKNKLRDEKNKLRDEKNKLRDEKNKLYDLMLEKEKRKTEGNELYLDKFLKSLKGGKINPDLPATRKIINMILRKYPNQLLAVAGDVNASVDLYLEVKSLPATFTRGIIQEKMNISINGPMPGQTAILTAIDKSNGKRYLIKLLSFIEFVQSVSQTIKKDAIAAEVDACKKVSKANFDRLVISEVVEITITNPEGTNASVGTWTALKMRHYHSPLTSVPQLPENLLIREYHHIKTALKNLHSLNLVHMDVKSENIFVDEEGGWFLGDFGSCRSVNSPNFSFTDIFNPYTIIQFKTPVIPSMDMVLLCVMISVEMEKETWKTRLCGDFQKVQPALILQSLEKIENEPFRIDLVNVFNEHFAKVQNHLRKLEELEGLDSKII